MNDTHGQEQKIAGWTALCGAEDVEVGQPRRIELDGRAPLAVFNLDGEFFVTDDTCTHGAASLCDGFVEGDEVECPWHVGKFCIRTGMALTFPAVIPIKTYKVKVVEGKIFIEL